MRRRIFSGLLMALASVSLSSTAWAQGAPQTLRVLTHSSFDLPKPLLAQFEKEAGVKLQVVKGGDAGEMVNKLILTRAKPIADVVYGIDNTLLSRAASAGVLDAYDGPAARRAVAAGFADGA
ncbi:MAG: thiamine ABC transporter substrate-binding protein, partial [Hydrogenophaga sp.]|nr:thiamine ABC transporter substrate-binding protein [Hydrogenophaga sp.]